MQDLVDEKIQILNKEKYHKSGVDDYSRPFVNSILIKVPMKDL